MLTVSGRVLQIVLEYLYTGRCLFPQDDLNLGIEVRLQHGVESLCLCCHYLSVTREMCVCVVIDDAAAGGGRPAASGADENDVRKNPQ